jgi:hypothetical protein
MIDKNNQNKLEYNYRDDSSFYSHKARVQLFFRAPTTGIMPEYKYREGSYHNIKQKFNYFLGPLLQA